GRAARPGRRIIGPPPVGIYFIVRFARDGLYSLSMFGLFFLSLGTNLPELALAFESIRHRRREIAFGDFLGSSAANTLILGLLGLVAPFGGAGNGRLFGALVLLGSVCVYFLWAISSGREISRKEGVGLLVFYLLFVAYELFM
ncbi:MAG: Na+/Ca+ antiporter, CaCA family, partial [Candidatus Uhrbacteria bacterium GW2011_GWA2_53_10]